MEEQVLLSEAGKKYKKTKSRKSYLNDADKRPGNQEKN